MNVTRIGGATLLLLAACMWERKPLEEAVLSYENLSPREVDVRIRSRLSEKGKIEFLGDGKVRIVDYHENVARVANSLETADHSPFTALLNFQLIQGTHDGPVDEKLVPIAAALRDVVRFSGFELMGEATVSATEGESEDENLEMTDGHEQYVVGVEVADIRATNTRNGSVELAVRLRRDGRANMLTTNVVVPVGKSVILGRTHPDDTGEAVLLVVRPELDVAEPSRRGEREVRVRVGVGDHARDTMHGADHLRSVIEQQAVQQARQAMEAALARSQRIDCPGGRGCRREEEQLRQARQALIEVTLAQLRIEFEQGRLSPEQYEQRKREVTQIEPPVRTRATTPPQPTRRPPPV